MPPAMTTEQNPQNPKSLAPKSLHMATERTESTTLSTSKTSQQSRRSHLIQLGLSGALPVAMALAPSSSSEARADQMRPSAPYVFAYTSHQSIAPGEDLGIHISGNVSKVNLVVTRVGLNSEVVFEKLGIEIQEHAIPDRASSHGCNWPVAFQFKASEDWKSGYYTVTIVSAEEEPGTPPKAQAQQYFVLRAKQPGATSKILLQLSTNTYNAYTNWGGHSLYAYHDRDGVQGHRVSFDRPIFSQFETWEGPFVRWAEANGYTLEYAANNDLEFHPEILANYNLVLSVGHDEYWSSPMRDNLEKFIADGGNVAFFSGNTCCWQIRNEDNGRNQTCWKQWYNTDPYFRSDKEHLLSTLWSHHLVKRPENMLTGVGFLFGGYHKSHGQLMDGPGSYEVHRPEHWLFEGTGLKRGDRFGGEHTIVGYECDGCEMRWEDGLPYPTHNDGTPESFTILGSCPAIWEAGDCMWYDKFPKGRVGASVLGTYTQGGTVVTSGSTDWSHGLSGNDPAVTQITKNVLNKLSHRS